MGSVTNKTACVREYVREGTAAFPAIVLLGIISLKEPEEKNRRIRYCSFGKQAYSQSVNIYFSDVCYLLTLTRLYIQTAENENSNT